MAQVDKYKKVSFNGGTIFGLLIFLIIVGGLIFLMLPTPKEKIYNSYKGVEGNTLPAKHNLSEVSFNKLKKEVKSMDADEFLIVYYGTSSCNGCVTNLGTIVTKTRDILNVDKVLYFNSVNDTKASEIKSVFGNDKIGDKTPEVWVFKGGKLLTSTAEFIRKEATEDVIKWDSFWLKVENEMGIK